MAAFPWTASVHHGLHIPLRTVPPRTASGFVQVPSAGLEPATSQIPTGDSSRVNFGGMECLTRGSNPQPSDYETDALPRELDRRTLEILPRRHAGASTVRPAGFEPATSALPARRASRLRYDRLFVTAPSADTGGWIRTSDLSVPNALCFHCTTPVWRRPGTPGTRPRLRRGRVGRSRPSCGGGSRTHDLPGMNRASDLLRFTAPRGGTRAHTLQLRRDERRYGWLDSNQRPERSERPMLPLHHTRVDPTLEPRTRKRQRGIEPRSSGWKPGALPLSYSRVSVPVGASMTTRGGRMESCGGGIRTHGLPGMNRAHGPPVLHRRMGGWESNPRSSHSECDGFPLAHRPVEQKLVLKG